MGRRLSLWALAKIYDKKIVYSGPIYKSSKIVEEKIIIEFDHIGSGLTTCDSKKLVGFTIAGADQKFVPADAEIVGDTVVVSSSNISKPTAVRYAWANNPQCNLCNQQALPASPFRTDDWPGVTFGL